MRILSAHIFSKSFGGKIQYIWTNVTYRDYNFKQQFGARVFWAPISFLAGKLKTSNRILPKE